MGTIVEDIKKQSELIVEAFKEDGFYLDYSINSTMQIDKFFFANMEGAEPKKNGRLPKKGVESILFSIGSYLGETIIKNIPGSKWVADNNDPEVEMNVLVKLPSGVEVWPIIKVFKRFQVGREESIYPYAYEICKNFAGKDYTKEPFDDSFWNLEEDVKTEQLEKKNSKPWWKFW